MARWLRAGEDDWVVYQFEEVSESRGDGCYPCGLLQLRQNPQDSEDYPKHGRWPKRSCLVTRRNYSDGRQLSSETSKARALQKERLRVFADGDSTAKVVNYRS